MRAIGAVASTRMQLLGMSSLRLMQVHDEFPFRRFSAPSSSGRPARRRLYVSRSTSRTKTHSNKCMNFKKFLEPPQKNLPPHPGRRPRLLPGPPARCGARARSHSAAFRFPDRLDRPVRCHHWWHVAAPLQFFADRSLAGAGNAFDQTISHAHR